MDLLVLPYLSTTATILLSDGGDNPAYTPLPVGGDGALSCALLLPTNVNGKGVGHVLVVHANGWPPP
jgi:hypothetical protein